MAHIPTVAGLTEVQQTRVLKLYASGAGASRIACQLALTRQYVQVFLRAHRGDVYDMA